LESETFTTTIEERCFCETITRGPRIQRGRASRCDKKAKIYIYDLWQRGQKKKIEIHVYQMWGRKGEKVTSLRMGESYNERS